MMESFIAHMMVLVPVIAVLVVLEWGGPPSAAEKREARRGQAQARGRHKRRMEFDKRNQQH